ncbi:hypothetical protein EV421DRAFT_2041568 [Armillaria borealis]|uniref:Uncharacterized protein n=1 Tax=Armillaria borealis TaxID=47425 RepID=A0AA39IWL6_9AGAR|nr:hypothetical protein EV421DRAFT_2041568 [Armillaria borealis]
MHLRRKERYMRCRSYMMIVEFHTTVPIRRCIHHHHSRGTSLTCRIFTWFLFCVNYSLFQWNTVFDYGPLFCWLWQDNPS